MRVTAGIPGMKKLILLAVLGTAVRGLAQDVLHLGEGQSFTFQFTSLPFVQAGALEPLGGAAFFNFSGNLLDPGERLRIELFENSFGEAPVQVFEEHPISVRHGAGAFASLAWQDLQGAVRLTMLQGSLDVSSLVLTAVNNDFPDNMFTYYQQVIPVPEPSSMLIAIVGACTGLCFAVARRRRRRGFPPGDIE